MAEGEAFPSVEHRLWASTLRAGRVNALLLGLLQEGKWVYIGAVASGLTAAELQILTEWLPQLEREKPVVINPPRIRDGAGIWVEPVLTVEVKYLEWTPDGTLRSPSVIAFKQKE